MLAAHRDQENLVHAHQAPTKQQPKTPGSRYPKTPLGRFGRNDENAATAFTGKNMLAGSAKNTINGRVTGKLAAQRQVLATPLGNQSRAPLGNKTTNAKARPNQSAAVKDRVKQIETSQAKPSLRPKLRQPELSAPKFEVQADKAGASADDEPEYAPPAPTALPYESDVLPQGGLTFNALKKDNILKGYYEHFYNPVDEDGTSRLDKAFNNEMKAAMDKAVEQNEREFESLDWSVVDVPETKIPSNRVLAASNSRREPQNEKIVVSKTRNVQTMNSRKAASALAIHSDRGQGATSTRDVAVKRPVPSFSRSRAATPSALEQSCAGTTTGEAASRTTIGYNKGRAASTMMRPRQQPTKNTAKVASRQPSDDGWNMTITPTRSRLGAQGRSPTKSIERPQFASIFYDDEDDAEPLAISGPPVDLDDDEEFELKLEI